MGMTVNGILMDPIPSRVSFEESVDDDESATTTAEKTTVTASNNTVQNPGTIRATNMILIR